MLSDRYEVSLREFNQEFFEALEDNQYIKGPTIENISNYHTVYVDGEPAGVVGYLPPKIKAVADAGFVQIILASAYRGKGLIGKVYDLLAEKHSLKTLYATIYEKNTTSIQAHEKIGFKMLSPEKMADLRHRGLLDDDDIRLVKYL